MIKFDEVSDEQLDAAVAQGIHEVKIVVTHSLNDVELRRAFQYYACTFACWELYEAGHHTPEPEGHAPYLSSIDKSNPRLRAAVERLWPKEQ